MAKVSQSTVSVILSGRWKSRRISLKTKQKVEAAAQRLNYRPNRVARGLKCSKTHLIALLIRTMDHPLQSAVNALILKQLAAHDFQTMVVVQSDGQASFPDVELLSGILSYRPEGVIAGPLYGEAPIRSLDSSLFSRLPLVGFAGNMSEPFDHVSYDRAEIVSQAIHHLREQGHRQIGCVIGGASGLIVERFTKLAKNSSIEIADESHADRRGGPASPAEARVGFLVRYGTVENGVLFAAEFASWKERPSAFFFQDERFAFGFMKGCLDQGLKVPQDVAFVTGSRSSLAGYSPLSFTTVYPDLNEMAEAIVRVLMRRIQGDREGCPEQIQLAPRLILGETTRCDVALAKTPILR